MPEVKETIPQRFFLRENARSRKVYVSERVPGRATDVPRFSYPLEDKALAENAVDVLNHIFAVWSAVKKEAPKCFAAGA